MDFHQPRRHLTRSNTFVVHQAKPKIIQASRNTIGQVNSIGQVTRNNLGHYYIANLPPRLRSFTSRNISTQTLPVTECKGTTSSGENSEKDSSEFLCPSFGPIRNGYYADKECSTPSTVPLEPHQENEIAPSLGASRFQVNVLNFQYYRYSNIHSIKLLLLLQLLQMLVQT